MQSGRKIAPVSIYTLSRMTNLPSWGAFLAVLALGTQAVAAQPLPLKDKPVPGWPKLQIETRYLARIAMRGYCLEVPAGKAIPKASFDSCARPDFWRGVCDIFIDIQYAGSADLREHEESRCRGYDYRDSDLLADALRAWREHGENRYAYMLDFESMMFVLEPSTRCAYGDPSCIEVRD
jgi:hypothetical protein